MYTESEKSADETREPSNMENKITKLSDFRKPVLKTAEALPTDDFGERLTRIRGNLKRINALMAELKGMQG